MFSLICAWINGWVNNREAGDLRRHRGHYDVNVMANSSRMPLDSSKATNNGPFRSILASLWLQWGHKTHQRHKSLTVLFFQRLDKAYIKLESKLRVTGHYWGKYSADQWFPSQRTGKAESVMTSSCINGNCYHAIRYPCASGSENVLLSSPISNFGFDFK